ncbi:hypothetical protein [Cupriavidus sp. YAF13]|uniref:hypothetical protein n=1 Tax=Cupriavidus sp. YAF13 TaxID=3233075 RepID=UPI003F9045A5
MPARFFDYRDFEVTAFAEQSFTGLWVATYHAFPFAESASESPEEVLSFRFLCDGRKHRLVWNAEEAAAEAAALARAAIDTKLLMASLRN